MSASTYRVAIEATGTDRGASQTMRSIDSSVANAGKSATQAASSFRNLAGAFTAMLVAQKAREGLTSIAKSAMDFESSLTRLRVLTSGYNVDMGKMKAAAISAAEKTIYGPQEAVDALIKLTQATGNANTAMGTLDSTLGLAMASLGKLSPERAARMASDVIKSFGAEGMTDAEINTNLKKRFDQFYNITRALGIEIQTFEKIMGRAGQAALVSGQSYEDTLMGMTLAARGAPSTLRASNQFLRQATELITKGEPIFRKFDVAVRDVNTNKIRPYMDIMTDLAKKYEENPEGFMAIITGGGIKGEKAFGAGAIQPLLTTMNALQKIGLRTIDDKGKSRILRGADAVAHLRKEMQKLGAVDAASAAQMASTAGVVQQAEEAWENMKRVLGEALLPVIISMGKMLKTIGDALRKLADSETGKWISKIIVPATALVTLMLSLKATFWGIKSIVGVTGMNLFGGMIKSFQDVAAARKAAVVANQVALASDSFNAFRTVGGGAPALAAGAAPSRFAPIKEALGGFKAHLILGSILAVLLLISKSVEKAREVRAARKENVLLDMRIMFRGGRELSEDELVKRLAGVQQAGTARNILGKWEYDKNAKEVRELFEMERIAYITELMSKDMNDMAIASGALKDNFTIASGMLQSSLEQLKDVSKAKTQIIDVKQMNSIIARLEASKFATPGDEMTRRGTVAMGKSITEDLRKLTTTGLSPTEYKAMAQKVSAFAIGAEDISVFHRGTISPAMMKALQKQLVDPTLAGGSMLQARRTDILNQLRGYRSYLGGGEEFLPGHGAPVVKGSYELAQQGPTMKSLEEEKDRKRKEEEARKSPVERVLDDMNRKAQEQLTKLDRIAFALEDLTGGGPFSFLGLRG